MDYDDDLDLHSLFEWLRIAEDTFENSGIENGSVEFTCPQCCGKSHYSRLPLQDSYDRKVMVKGYCEGCNISVLS